ncbi:hypothetical protein HMPREF1221_00007 [Treponema socranskii subsp. paredis ATCC 35535]|nr:hypothetical protein HMPREF1221_00007 [Treponema socranskii subsp. paredis ATCC 35535]
MKRVCLLPVLLILFSTHTFADEFTDALQFLAVQIACVGQYSAAQAGGGRYEDPHDYYTPQLLADFFKEMSGSKTRTETFYGVCFDYAQYAYDTIKTYQSFYNKAGMYGSQFWIASTNGTSSVITLSCPAREYSATLRQNGVPVKEVNRMYVSTHKISDGERARNHAWVWVRRYDGVWFWIDPTWTDNAGYVIYGYVTETEEIQLRPDSRYCITSPSYLNDLPLPPEAGKRSAPIIPNSADGVFPAVYDDTAFDVSGDFITSIGFLPPYINNSSWSNFFSYSLSYETTDADFLFLIAQFDLYSKENWSKLFLLFGLGAGWQWGEVFGLYGGGGLGMIAYNIFKKAGFAWKVNGGIRISFGDFSTRYDVAYVYEEGVVFSLFFGFQF